MTEVAAKPPDTREFERVVRAGGVVVFPTDTLYGIGCRPDDDAAVERVYALKQRPRERPSAVMYFSLEQGLAAGYKAEHERFGELAVSSVSRKLVQIFFLTNCQIKCKS